MEVTFYFGGSPADVTDLVENVTIRRGRTRELDTFTTGLAQVVLFSADRTFDPLYKSGPYYGQLLPRVRVTVTNDGISLFDGYVEDWNLDWTPDGIYTATALCVDGLALLAATALEEHTNDEQSPGERITAIINRPEVAYPGATDIDPGFAVLQADTVQANANTLTYLQTVTSTDLGRLFVDGSGVLRYRDRTSGVTQEPRVIFGVPTDPYMQALATLSSAVLWFDASSPSPVRLDDDGLAQTVLQDAVLWFDASSPDYVAPIIDFSAVGIALGSDFLFNRISVARQDGEVMVANDTTSQAQYGIRTYSSSELLFHADAETQSYADYLASLYAQPAIRISEHTVVMHSLSDLHQRYVQRLEIGDVVRTIWTPNDVGDAIDQVSLVEGIGHTITPAYHEIRFQLTPFSRAGFILDDANRGLLDTSEMTY